MVSINNNIYDAAVAKEVRRSFLMVRVSKREALQLRQSKCFIINE